MSATSSSSSSMSSPSIRSVPMVGLTQLGNSCFLNSIVQSLYLTDDFRSSLTSLHLSPAEMKRFATLRAIQHLFGLLMYCIRPSYSPKAFRAEMPAIFNNGSQQDADEFAKFLLEREHSQWKELHHMRTAQATGKRKAEDANMEGQPEQKVAAITDRAALPSPPPSAEDPPSGDRLGERQSQHGQIRGGAAGVLVSSTSMPLIVSPRADRSFPLFPSAPSTVSPPISSSSAPPATLSSSASAASSSTSLMAPVPTRAVPSSSSSDPPAAPSPSSSSPGASPQHDLDPQFGGVIASCITCLRCGKASVKEEAFLELPLPMQQMDEEQRIQLHERIQAAKEKAQISQPMDMATVEATPAPSSRLAAKPVMATVIPQPPLARSAAKTLPHDVYAKILAFAAPQQASHSFPPPSRPTLVNRPSPMSIDADSSATSPASRSIYSTSSSTSSVSPSLLSTASASVSVPTSSASSLPSSVTVALPPKVAAASSSSAAPSASASVSAVDASSTSALLAAFLAQLLQTTVQATLLTGVTTLTTAAALAQQQAAQKKEHDDDQSRMKDEAAREEEPRVEDKSTALILYTPPPQPVTSAPSTQLVVVPSASASSPSSSSSPSLLLLTSMLDLWLSPELLVGENAYHCSHCASKQSATLSCSISSPPPHLLIALKRNEFDAKSQLRTKILTEVQFPAFLHLPSTASPAASYALYSVVVHSGLSADSGHYYTIGRRSGDLRRRMRQEMHSCSAAMQDVDGSTASETPAGLEEVARGGAHEFFHFNDETVTSASFTTIRQVTKRQPLDVAYLLFYVRVDDEGLGDAGGDGATAAENPLLARLAVVEQATFERLQEKERKELAKKAEQMLVGLKATAPYKPPPEEWTDPDF